MRGSLVLCPSWRAHVGATPSAFLAFLLALAYHLSSDCCLLIFDRILGHILQLCFVCLNRQFRP
jgi:hypothetical protein